MDLKRNFPKVISKKTTCLTFCVLLACILGLLPLPDQWALAANQPMDLVFVIDNSGSMKKNDPEFTTRQAINEFVVKLPDQSRVGMVLFDENARLLHRLRIISSPRVQEQFVASLDKIDYAGSFTNSPGGIERALYELKTNGRQGSQKAIIFITDGMVTTGSKSKNKELTQWLKEDLTRELGQLGIRIYGVAFTEAADFSLIQTLASRTQGEYYRADDATQIQPAFEQIYAQLNPQQADLPGIQPLPTLPTTSSETPEVPAGNDIPASSDQPIVVVAPTPWMLYFWLALITVMLAAAAILFFTRQHKAKQEPAPSTQPLVRLPEARIQDLDGACKGSAASFELTKVHLSIGRGEQNDICIPQTTISKHHATIEYTNLAYYLTDLKSTNGTRINGEPLNSHEPVRLKNGDRISFGRFQFQFDMPEQIQFNETVLLSRTSLNDPEDQATIMIDLQENSDQDSLVACLQHHLMQIEALGPKFKSFVGEHFSYETLKALAADGDQILKKSHGDQQLHYTSLVKNKLFYLICSLPVPTHSADKWYGATHGGFTQFARQWVKSDAYQAAKCNMLCIVTFGRIPTHWVSITIVPTHHEPDPVEIISVDFLNPDEKAALALNHGQNGRTA